MCCLTCEYHLGDRGLVLSHRYVGSLGYSSGLSTLKVLFLCVHGVRQWGGVGLVQEHTVH